MGQSILRRGLALALLLAACTSATPPPAEEAVPTTTAWSISIETHACLDDVCARYDLWLDARGDVLWFGRDKVDEPGATPSVVLPEVAEPLWLELAALRTEALVSTERPELPERPEQEIHRVGGGGDVRYRHRFEITEAGKQQAFELHVEPTVEDPGPWLSFMRRMELMAGRYRLDGEQLYCHHAAGSDGVPDPECMRSADRSAWWIERR
ncbi:hypothetical protein [Paraliomyxa miuraensis]|uniref:hypothetical protein n=1 Tax=Paraliomyxa miuraensis TaxID=376150 RepID=UPI00224D6098|nr:hypothetical protein [Paraliomyxa miuraensis]MCX4240725.1 hypothetical protein [Paraliomyxa miuraensis]